MNPSNTGLLKMLPRYLRLSATSSWDQIGMLLRQSRTTHPLVSPVMCVTACVGEYHVLFNYKCTLSTVVDVQGMVRLQVPFEVCVCVCVSNSSSKTWCFNASCQVVYIQLSQDTHSSLQASDKTCWKLFLSNFDVGCVFYFLMCCKNNAVAVCPCCPIRIY